MYSSDYGALVIDIKDLRQSRLNGHAVLYMLVYIVILQHNNLCIQDIEYSSCTGSRCDMFVYGCD